MSAFAAGSVLRDCYLNLRERVPGVGVLDNPRSHRSILEYSKTIMSPDKVQGEMLIKIATPMAIST